MMTTGPSAPSAAHRQALTGRNIVVTRPEKQAKELAELIRAEGGRAILFPAVEIIGAADLRPLRDSIDRLEQFDMAIFISANAVTNAMSAIVKRRTLPETLRIAAIGAASRNALLRYGVKQVIHPTSRYDSEALLDLPELRDVVDKNIVIFRGQGGRELLGEILRKRGARIEYVECYQRVKPSGDPTLLKRLWANNELHAVTVTSSEGLRNLFEMMDATGKQMLREIPLFVPHQRIAEEARKLGLAAAVVTDASDAGLVRGLIEWFWSKTG